MILHHAIQSPAINSALWRRYFVYSNFNFTRFSLILDVFLVQNQLLHSFRSSVRSSRFGFGEPEHVWRPHHVHSARKRRETIVFTQLGRGGDVVDTGRGCGGLQPNILVRMKVFSLYFHYCEHWPDCQMVPNMNTGAKCRPHPTQCDDRITSCLISISD